MLPSRPSSVSLPSLPKRISVVETASNTFTTSSVMLLMMSSISVSHPGTDTVPMKPSIWLKTASTCPVTSLSAPSRSMGSALVIASAIRSMIAVMPSLSSTQSMTGPTVAS